MMKKYTFKEKIEYYSNKYHNTFSIASSMNGCYIKEIIKPKVLIVGTLTPESNKGYYYTALNKKKNGSRSKYNIYNYINNANIGINICISDIENLETIDKESNKKENLESRIKALPQKNKEVIEEIRTSLNEKGIYFFDVIKYAIRKEHGNASDSNLRYYELDNESFNKIDLSDCVIIANSKMALENLNILLNNNPHSEFKGEIACVPQMARSYSRKRNKDLSNYCIFMAWKNMINYALYRKLENEVFNKYILHYTDKMCWPYK